MNRGLSLVETLVAIFLLTGAAFASIALLMEASRAQRLTTETQRALGFAQQSLDRIEAWAREPANFASGWSIYADSSFPEPADPAFVVRIQANPSQPVLVSPNTSLEMAYASPLQRRIASRACAVKATVSWLSVRPRAVVLWRWMGAPLSEVSGLQVNQTAGASSPLAVNATATFDARLLDTSSQPIPGVIYYWKLEPDYNNGQPGMASLETLSRQGNQAVLIHHYYAGDPDNPKVPGDIGLRAYCRYGGKEWASASLPLSLSP